jgi:hypothetical protein
MRDAKGDRRFEVRRCGTIVPDRARVRSGHNPQTPLDSAISDLDHRREQFSKSSLTDRLALVDRCLQGVLENARDWVDVSCEAKGIAAGSPCRAEEVALGPLVTARHLQLIRQGLWNTSRWGRPILPGDPRIDPDRRLRVPVVPARGLFDPLVFPGFRAWTWLQPGVTKDELFAELAHASQSPRDAGISLVLGAGNVSSIPATDAFGKLFHAHHVVLLKMHPVNEYLGPIFARAFSALIDSGYLRIVYGGAEEGAAAVADDRITDVHITGSIETHDTIVWGPRGSERERRRAAGLPLLKKPISSELGNVSPWIVLPGEYSSRQLMFQAENIASSIVNNASFACAATRVIITWDKWQARDRFLGAIERVLAATQERKAYYPGALDRFRDFTGIEPKIGPGDTLPWTLLRDLDPHSPSRLFEAESFVCVCVEVALGGESQLQFLENAVEFANEALWGTLCAALTVPSGFRRDQENERRLQQCLGRLRYGCVGINQWPGLMYSLLTPPWGGYPGSTPADAQSGIGWVHNTYGLPHVEKTVLEGPLTLFPKPIWFPSHADPEPAAWAAVNLYGHPSLLRLPGLAYDSLVGHFAKPRLTSP